MAFAILLYQFHRLKEHLLRTDLTLFGHPVHDGPGRAGTARPLISTRKASRPFLQRWIGWQREFERLVIIYDENPSVEDRVRDTGVLKPEQARDLCVVGFVARASGLNLDCRIHHPFLPDRIGVNVPGFISGDVHVSGVGEGGRGRESHQDHP